MDLFPVLGFFLSHLGKSCYKLIYVSLLHTYAGHLPFSADFTPNDCHKVCAVCVLHKGLVSGESNIPHSPILAHAEEGMITILVDGP